MNSFHIFQLSFCKVKREAALHLDVCRNATALPPRCGSRAEQAAMENWGFTSTDDQRLFCRCPSRPRSFWSMFMKSHWLTSSRRIPCCTSTQSRWPRWCGCGNSWNHSELICSAAGPQWRRICGAGKSQMPAHAACFSCLPGSECLLSHLLPDSFHFLLGAPQSVDLS